MLQPLGPGGPAVSVQRSPGAAGGGCDVAGSTDGSTEEGEETGSFQADRPRPLVASHRQVQAAGATPAGAVRRDREGQGGLRFPRKG